MKRWTVAAILASSICMAPLALAQVPAAENAAAAKAPNEHAAPEGAGEGEEKKGEEAHEFGPPPAFNFADFDRYGREKDAATKGAEEPPVVPYVYVLINALILYAMYYYLGKKPIGEGLKARRDAIAKELDEAAKIKSEAKAKLAEYSDRLDKLDQELERLKGELILAGEKDRDRIVQEANERAERMKKDAQFLLDQEMKQLRNDMQRYAVEAAMRAAESALSTKVSAQDRDRVADEYLSMLGAQPATAKASQGGAS